ncbi:hypothetical protein BKA69DRAFT_544693 [Paraphysoderma sedebokerense]|nr:hypothetical protein BKA69DRAFT_544693 [Paraphysoderma sedebokerense]
MVKKYYCEYCDCRFPDSSESRKKHKEGAQHQLNVQRHYDQFKTPQQIIEEQRTKQPCRRFMNTGGCNLGFSCKYSHFPGGLVPFELLEPYQANVEADKSLQTVRLPRELLRLQCTNQLPPSLVPPSKGLEWDVPDVASWG